MSSSIRKTSAFSVGSLQLWLTKLSPPSMHAKPQDKCGLHWLIGMLLHPGLVSIIWDASCKLYRKDPRPMQTSFAYTGFSSFQLSNYVLHLKMFCIAPVLLQIFFKSTNSVVITIVISSLLTPTILWRTTSPGRSSCREQVREAYILFNWSHFPRIRQEHIQLWLASSTFIWHKCLIHAHAPIL